MNDLLLTDAEIEELLGDLESDRAERKESLAGDAPTKIRQAICAFANDLPDHRLPGVVIVGARDDGSLSNLLITDELLLQLANMKSDGNIVPPLTMAVAKRRLGPSDLAVVTVAPSDAPPVKFKGRIWIRVGPQRAIATSQDERILNEKRRHRDRAYDARPVPSATLDDLNQYRFEHEYLPSAVSRDALAANDRSLEQRLAATKMILSVEEPTPTVLGVLVLATRTRDFLPCAYVQFLRIDGTQLGDPVVDEQVLDGSLSDIMRRVDEKLQAQNATAVDITSGPLEVRHSTYPLVALQQIMRNAVMHRTYEATNAPVRITWYNDRIEVQSPGGPYGIVHKDNFGQPGVTDYRNPNLAEAMKVMGYVQRYGLGLATARRVLEENNHPGLEFDVQPTIIGVTIRARP